MDPYGQYDNPLVTRYASPEMSELFSPRTRIRTWRRLWVALAEAESELGLGVTAEQVEELRAHVDGIDFAEAERIEAQVRHDVMAHIRAYGAQCPKARGIIHLGATSAYVVDNADLLILRDALRETRRKLVNVVDALARFARTHRDVPTMGLTHLQPAQVTTVGRRACLWAQEAMLDLAELDFVEGSLRFLGAKGAIGTQASFLALFQGDDGKVQELDRRVAEKMGFPSAFRVTGQTYTRKLDARALAALSSIAQSATKFANDVRILQSRREMEEPFEEEQVGSSAMAYKRNPMRSERIASLGRLVISNAQNGAWTAASQWFERTLDDSANKRVAMAEGFLAADGMLLLWLDVAGGLAVRPAMISKNLRDELPFLATEEVLMLGVKAGGDRQELHERIRRHSMAAVERLKAGEANDLMERIGKDAAFASLAPRLPELLDARRHVGRAPAQVDEFLREEVEPVLARHKALLGLKASIRV